MIESSLEKGRGAVATVLVQRGTLKLGDAILAGQEFGRVRAMFDERGKPVMAAGPSIPVVVLGLSAAPNAGDELLVVESERKAREVALYRQGKFRDVKLAQQTPSCRGRLLADGRDAKAQTIQLLIKADVQGRREALRKRCRTLSTAEVAVKVVGSSVGGITESDVMLAAASKARIIAFNVRGDAPRARAIKDHGIDVRYYSIIYEAIDDVRAALTGMLAPEVQGPDRGLAEVRERLPLEQVRPGGRLPGHRRLRQAQLPIRVLRDNVVIFEGALESLRASRTT